MNVLGLAMAHMLGAVVGVVLALLVIVAVESWVNRRDSD